MTISARNKLTCVCNNSSYVQQHLLWNIL